LTDLTNVGLWFLPPTERSLAWVTLESSVVRHADCGLSTD